MAKLKLNQVIALVAGVKKRAQTALTDAYQTFQKTSLLSGMDRTYRPKIEDGDVLPPERTLVQVTVPATIKALRPAMEDMFNVVLTQESGNCVAKADVKIDDKVILANAPVSYLLFLEKQLGDIETFVAKIPTLDPADEWVYNVAIDGYASKPYETLKTKKVLKNHVKAEATEKHPAQVETYTEDVVIGTWANIKFSGAIPAKDRNGMLERVRQLRDAVLKAREEANNLELEPIKTAGPAVFGYVFGDVK